VGMTMRAAADVAPLMRAAVSRALALDPQLPEAHATLGTFSFYYEHDWPGAERSLLRAIHFGPSFASAHRSYAFGLMFMRRFDEAEHNFSKARALDPLDAQTRVHQGLLRLYQRRFDEARVVFGGMLEANANNVIARTLLAYTCLHSGDVSQAERHYRETIVRHPDLSIGHCGLALTLARVGRIADARRSQTDLVEYAKTAFVSPYQFAMIECALGNDVAALHELERAAVTCDYNFLCSAVDPAFDRLHNTPGWMALMRRFGFPEN
jgi:tetratricopeptide (TPR) repeat protein